MLAKQKGRSVGVPASRRIFHLAAGSLFPIAGFIFQQREMVVAAGVTLAVFAVGEMVRLLFDPISRPFVRLVMPLLKGEELRRPTGATYVVASSLIAFLLFDTPVAALSLLFLALGDPAAGLVGTRFGRRRLVWGKSLEGSLAFFLMCLVGGSMVVVAGGFEPFWVVPIGAAVAALVEVIPSPVDDNLTIPLVCGGAMSLLLS